MKGPSRRRGNVNALQSPRFSAGASMKGPSRRRGNSPTMGLMQEVSASLNEGPLQKEGQWRAWEQGSH